MYVSVSVKGATLKEFDEVSSIWFGALHKLMNGNLRRAKNLWPLYGIFSYHFSLKSNIEKACNICFKGYFFFYEHAVCTILLGLSYD